MSEDTQVHPSYTNEDVLKWVAAQIGVKREPAETLPKWMIGAFEDAIKMDKDAGSAGTAMSGRDAATGSAKQDDIFKFELVYFKVEETVFTVIKDWLMVDGSPFEAMFTLPGEGSTASALEGTRITNPIILEQTSAVSFKAFLCLLYGPRGNPIETYDELVGALELAVRWNFDQVREQAVNGLNYRLPSLGPAARICLAKRFSVGPWLRTGLIDIVTEVAERRIDRTALTNGTGFALDMSTVANIFFACFELEGLNRGFIQAGTDRRYSQVDCSSGNLRYIETCGDDGKYHEIREWYHHNPNEECRTCRALRDTTLTAAAEIVDRIFGEEIRGCIYIRLRQEVFAHCGSKLEG